MTEGSMSKGDRQSMMKSMMEQFFGGMDADEKKEMCATMIGKITEGLDMREMMPKMMTGMISGGHDEAPGNMEGMMAKMMQGGGEQQLPEMMLKTMMPHCIGMMLPKIDMDKRGDVGAIILSAIVEKGSVDMSEEQARTYRKALVDVIDRSA